MIHYRDYKVYGATLMHHYINQSEINAYSWESKNASLFISVGDYAKMYLKNTERKLSNYKGGG